MAVENDFAESSKYYDLILGIEEYRKNALFVNNILKRHRVKSILELGCGSGLYLFPLKKAGFEIEGLDISKKMLELARQRDKNIKLYQKDMSDFHINKEFDSILCLNSSLVLLPNFEQMVKTIELCNKHLKKEGLLILDLPNHEKEIKESNFSQEYEHFKLPNGKLDVILRDYKKKDKWVSEWFGLIKKGNKFGSFTEHYEEFIFSPKALEKAIIDCGFIIINLYGSRRGGEFISSKSYRRFYVCQKT